MKEPDHKNIVESLVQKYLNNQLIDEEARDLLDYTLSDINDFKTEWKRKKK